jgi:membrane associated rhomboid family serine protease
MRSILALIAINLALPFLVGGIAWQAHVGGLLTGGLITAAYAYAPRERRSLIQAAATVVVVAVLVVAVVIRNHQILTSGL